MKLLVLGGTVFVGRHIVETALVQEHQVTMFNRGESNAELFPDVEKLTGDRDGGLDALAAQVEQGRKWDAVIDTCGYIPRIVKQSVELLKDATEHYTFISTVSVYADFSVVGIMEDDPLARLETETEEITGETYGALKALCEWEVQQAFPGKALIVRPGLIVGPHDPTDRFTYWPRRVAQGGEVLAPGKPHAPVQIIDARDLAEWTLRMVTTNRNGIYNAVGPEYPLTMQEVLDTSRRVSGSLARFTWMRPEYLLDQGVEPWTDLPLWLHGEEYAGMDSVDNSKAIAAGLKFRSLEQTIGDTLGWDDTRPEDLERRAGISREREEELLQAWHKSAKFNGERKSEPRSEERRR
ncbi:MAG: NAD-dependent epimerase/dehydratase family protein [Anaerolineales bacterium]|nr:NAD-dependent epimerase/dehydratase family protein [Anaerolineales bacterium]